MEGSTDEFCGHKIMTPLCIHNAWMSITMRQRGTRGNITQRSLYGRWSYFKALNFIRSPLLSYCRPFRDANCHCPRNVEVGWQPLISRAHPFNFLPLIHVPQISDCQTVSWFNVWLLILFLTQPRLLSQTHPIESLFPSIHNFFVLSRGPTSCFHHFESKSIEFPIFYSVWYPFLLRRRASFRLIGETFPWSIITECLPLSSSNIPTEGPKQQLNPWNWFGWNCDSFINSSLGSVVVLLVQFTFVG
jgi:hypothetical protein